MKISTRGRYALRVMIDLAEHGGGSYIPLKDICARQEISQKYLESIMALLSKGGLIDGVHGKGGGYRLCRPPEEYPVGEILRLTEGNLAPVACLEDRENRCERCEECATLDFWTGLYAVINQYIDKFTRADLVAAEEKKGRHPKRHASC